MTWVQPTSEAHSVSPVSGAEVFALPTCKELEQKKAIPQRVERALQSTVRDKFDALGVHCQANESKKRQ